ncbi:hypothetical protein Vretimale_4456 [Volvox reticuliferus]|uniref:Uncharacterized protein n=1 Tax=Volvox reticuliferus TaxID=1737510 RepID=A0A8J4FFF1_9CHLO|nr:hypothetical protein Vretifemale_3040 [Volvox reticuliferus]GIL99230.1 hypothetical protein Vretimale_4456 [Volvox reticuliferus]
MLLAPSSPSSAGSICEGLCDAAMAVAAVVLPAALLPVLRTRKFGLLTGLVKAVVVVAVTNVAMTLMGAARVGAVVMLTDTFFGHSTIAMMVVVFWSPFTPTGRAAAVPVRRS